MNLATAAPSGITPVDEDLAEQARSVWWWGPRSVPLPAQWVALPPGSR